VEELELRWLPTVSQVAFLTAPQMLTAGEQSALITIQLEDSGGNPATAGSNLAFALSTTSTMGSFLDSNGKALPGKSLTIPAGNSSATFEYLDLNGGTPTLKAAGGGFSATQQETVNVASTQLNSLYSFNPGPFDPTGGMIEDSSGNLFGTTFNGGTYDDGTVFELAAGSSTITTLATFNGTNGENPRTTLIEDSSGDLFGTTEQGGAAGFGTVFELVKGSSSTTTLASLSYNEGAFPFGNLIEDSNGNFFGTTSDYGPNGLGTIFELAKGSSTITVLASFNSSVGSGPGQGLLDVGGNLFGTTASGGTAGDGTVFELAQGSSTITTLASFNGSTGAIPQSGVVVDSSGNLFGTTYQGGTNGRGTVFELPKGSSTITTLASFNGTNGQYPFGGLIQDSSGNLYGTTSGGGTNGDGTVFELAKGNSTITALASSSNPNSNYLATCLLRDGSGNFFGTSGGGGASGAGTVFELAKGSSSITTLASFNNSTGGQPEAGLVQDSGGNLFGTTTFGGTDDTGTLFELPHGSSTISIVDSFTFSGGFSPKAGVIADSNGNLFGTTYSGGTNSDGIIFEVARGSSTITTLASFSNIGPGGNVSLIEDSGGNLFGTTSRGGANGDGTVFELAQGSSTITTLASFNGTNGAVPLSGLIQDSSGNLFGTTKMGGTDNFGTVFELAHGSSTITTLDNFDATNGAYPEGSLIEDSSGNLFGTTATGGQGDDGTVFELAAGSNTITTLVSFNGSNGSGPVGGLIQDSSGNLLGTTAGGGANGDGTIFELAHGSNAFTTLASFNGTNGAGPVGLIQGSNGNLFGDTSGGGPNGAGTLFELVPSTGLNLAFTNPAQALTPGAASTLSVQLKNQYGVSIAASAPVTVNLSSTSSTGVFLSGGSPVTSVTIPAGSGSVTFQYKDTVAGTPTLTASASGVSPAQQQESEAATATRLIFSVQPSNATAGSAISPAVTVEVLDQNSNLLTTDNTDQVTLSIASGPGSFSAGSTATLTVSGGIATFSNLVLDTAGTYTLSESATSGLTGSISSSFTISPGSMGHLSFSVQPSKTAAGSAVAPAVQVEVLDQENNLITTDSSDQVTLAVASGPGGITSGGTATVSGGIATFSNLILDTAGSYTLAETGTGGLSGANSSSFTVSALGADHLAFGIQPSTTTAGSAINPAVTVEVVDKFGNLITVDNSDQVTLSVASGAGGFAGGSPPPATVSGGIASFGNLVLDTAGSYTLGASANGLTGVTSSSFTVSAAGADHLNFSVQPGNTTAGTAITPAVQVEVLDKFTNLITTDNSDQVTLSIASGPSGGGFASNGVATVTVSGGVATFGKLIVNAAGNYTLAASATGGLTGPNSDSFTVNPARIGRLFFSVQPSTTTTAGTAIGPAVQVEVLDSFGNALIGDNTDTVTLTLANAGKGPSDFNNDSNTMTATVSGGIATFSNLVVDTAGSYSLAASAAGSVANAQSSAFTINPASVSSFAVSAPGTAIAGTAFNVGISARDTYGNVITNYDSKNALKLTCSDGQGVNPSSVKLSNGRANLLVILTTPDSVSLKVSASVAGVTIRGSSGIITVASEALGPGTAPTASLYSCEFVFAASSMASPALTSQLLTPQDNAATFSVIAQNDAQAQLDIADEESLLQQQDNLTVGTQITAVNVTKTPVGQNTTISVNLPPIIRIVTASTPGDAASFALTVPPSAQADSLDPVTVTALDANGNVVIDYASTITLSSTDPQFGEPITYSFTPDDQGSHTFYVSLDTAGIESLTVTQTIFTGQAIESGQMGPLDSGSSTVSGQGLVNIMPDAAVSLILNVPNTTTKGSTEGITVTAMDAFGNVAAGYTGTVNFSGQFGGVPVSGLPGSYTFASADQGSRLFPVTFKSTGSQTITVSDSKDLSLISQALVQIMAAPAKLAIASQPLATVSAGNSFGLVVEAVDSRGTVVSNFNGLVTMTLAGHPAGGSLGGVVTVQAVNGVATFSGLTLNKAGAGYSLKVTSGSVTTATTKAMSVTANTVSELVVITQPPSKIAADSAFGLKVAAEDGYGNVVTNYTGTVTLTLVGGPAGATVSGKLTVTLAKSVATFSGLKITHAGKGYRLKAASGSLPDMTTDQFTVVS
jgi:uncharacterized repeat protein (TIGR03803 family)